MSLREDIMREKKKRARAVYRQVKRDYPEVKEWAAEKEVARVLGVSESAVYKYLR